MRATKSGLFEEEPHKTSNPTNPLATLSTNIPRLAVIFLLWLSCGSCATVLMGSKQSINVNSNPSGAQVFVDGVNTGKTTPATIVVKRKTGTHMLKFERSGFEEKSHALTSRFNWLVAVDFFMWVIPGVVDLSVGAQNIYDGTVFVEMSPENIVPENSPPVIAVEEQYSFERLSDVDFDIPVNANKYQNRFALIIGNEDYSTYQRGLDSEVNVAFARNDASAFREYAEKTLGIPERNITFILDGTSGEMQQGIAKMNMIARNTNGEAEFFVYYAGHGLPEEKSRDPYLMPVDISGKFVNLGIPLRELYQRLTEYPSKRITVFLDACFSGGARDQGLLAARGVRLKPKNEILKGDIIVFSASTGEESALPYREKHHGFFTYYLLRKLRETKGDISYEELSKFLGEQVALESVIVNDKEQHPTTNISPDIIDTWTTWKLN